MNFCKPELQTTVIVAGGGPGIGPSNHGGGLLGSDTTGVYHYLDAGFRLVLQGSFTIALEIKQRYAPGPNARYLCSGATNQSSFRMYSGGAAGTGVHLAGWGGNPTPLTLGTNIQGLAAAGWVHIALVVDASTLRATWYVNGTPLPQPIPITGGALVNEFANFRIATHLTPMTESSAWDIDDFQLLPSAATAAQIATWAVNAFAANAPYGKACGATLTSYGGLPLLGNSLYGVTVSGPATAPYALAIGINPNMMQGIPLPLNLSFWGLPSCYWQSSTDVVLAGTIGAAGNTNTLFPIPNNPYWMGFNFYCQALVAGASFAASNPYAIAPGR